MEQIEARITLTTRVAVQKLAHGGIQELTANQVLQTQLKELREHGIRDQMDKRTKRLQKETNQRSWDLEEVIRARQQLERPIRARIRKGRGKKLILIIPTKKPD